MIVGLIGPVPQDIIMVSEMLVSDKDIQVVDSISVLRMADRKTLNSLTIKPYHKQYFLKKLESELGIVIVSGNLILSEDIVPWILNNGGVIVVVSRNNWESYDKDIRDTMEKYWGDKTIQKYNLETRFKNFYEKLQSKNEGIGNLFLVDVSDENSEQLNELLEVSQEWSESLKSGLKNEEILEMTRVRKDDNTMMTMEESIKNAMRELGMEVDGDEPVEKTVEKQPVKPEPKKPPKQPKVTKKAEEKVAEDFINPPEEAAKTDDSVQQKGDEKDEEVDAIFVKISGGHMAVLLPAGLRMEKQTIGGMEFNVATVGLPDLNSEKLQELTIVSQKPEQSVKVVKRTPIITKEEKPVKTTKTAVVSDDMSDLVAEKSRLDAEIKKYRQLGDIDTVNELRKQRRAIRNKINKLN